MIAIARHYRTGRWVRLAVEGALIAEAAPADGPEAVAPDDDWVAPAFWDLQVNGRWGVSFSDPNLTADQVAAIVLAQGFLGTARLCPTLISAPADDTAHGLRTIAEACESPPRRGRPRPRHPPGRPIPLRPRRLPGRPPDRGDPRPGLGRVPPLAGRLPAAGSPS